MTLCFSGNLGPELAFACCLHGIIGVRTRHTLLAASEADSASAEQEKDKGDEGEPKSRSSLRLCTDTDVINRVLYECKQCNVNGESNQRE